jgi:hypothetical protein
VPADPSESTQTRDAVVADDDRDRQQNDHDADLDRDRGSDLDDQDRGDPIVWFDPEALAAASAIEIGSHALEIAVLRSGPEPEHLAAALDGAGLSLARLPGWPGSGPSGQGWGPRLDALIGPIRPGFVGLIGANQRGAGRTSWLAQLADGLALRESDSLLTPVICIVEDDPRIFRARSLGRWAGIDPRIFLGHGDLERARAGLDALAGEWRALGDRQRFGSLEQLDDPGDLLAAIERWRVELAGGAAAIWPVLVIDALDSPERIPALARLAARHDLIILASLDDGAIGRAEDRHVDLRLRLHPHEHALELELVYARLGPRARVRVGWDRGCGRFDGDHEPS